MSSNNDPYRSSSFVGHSLWLMPAHDSPAAIAYQDLISQLANEYDTLEFAPHISLVAALMGPVDEIVETTQQLASQLAAYDFHLDHISFREAYFQCVYAVYDKTDVVLHANQLARQYFPERHTDPPYLPHLSLMYGDVDAHFKETILLPNINKYIQQQQNDNTMTVVPVDRIEVWSTQGHVQEWFRVATVPFTGASTEKYQQDEHEQPQQQPPERDSAKSNKQQQVPQE